MRCFDLKTGLASEGIFHRVVHLQTRKRKNPVLFDTVKLRSTAFGTLPANRHTRMDFTGKI